MIALVVALVLLAFDMQNAGARRRRVVKPGLASSSDYTIVVPLYGDPRHFANRARLAPFRRNTLLVVATTSDLMREFADFLVSDGWRVHRVGENLRVPGLVARGLDSVTTAWTIRLDGDTTFVEHPGQIVAAAAAGDADVCSVKILPSRMRSLVEKMQAVEYATSMLSRHHRPWLTSGACIVARTRAFRDVLALHSQWFVGEDIETGAIARRLRLRVAHIDATVVTDVPPTIRALVHQRRLWWAGSVRQTWLNADHAWDDPLAFVYSALLVWMLWLGKASALHATWRLLPLIVVAYTGVTLLSNWSVRSRWMILYPYYALAQSLLMPVPGIVEYVRIALRERSLGRYRMPHRAPAAQRSGSGSMKSRIVATSSWYEAMKLRSVRRVAP
jgi:hypothetical protein